MRNSQRHLSTFFIFYILLRNLCSFFQACSCFHSLTVNELQNIITLCRHPDYFVICVTARNGRLLEHFLNCRTVVALQIDRDVSVQTVNL